MAFVGARRCLQGVLDLQLLAPQIQVRGHTETTCVSIRNTSAELQQYRTLWLTVRMVLSYPNAIRPNVVGETRVITPGIDTEVS